MLRLLILN